MNWIQVLLIVSMLALLVYLLRSRGNAQSKAWVKVGFVLFVFAAIYAILRPDDTTVVANWLGVDRGTDLIAYALIIAFVVHHAERLHAIQGPGVALRQAGPRGRAAECPGPRGAFRPRKKPTVWATPSSMVTFGASRAPSRPG